MSERPYVEENRVQRERLKALVTRLSDADLRRAVGDGWTIAATLAHVAFWDQRVLRLLDRFERQGIGPSQHPPDVDAINDAAQALCLAIEPRVAVQLALDSAAQVDARLESLSDAMLAQLTAAGAPIKLLRAEHREYHLDEIESVLRSA